MQQNPFFDIDLERAILSACMMSEDAYGSIQGDIIAQDFSLKAHQDIFTAIELCVKNGEPLALSFIKKHRKLNEAVIAEILNTTAIVDVPRYALELREKATKRHLLDFAHTIPGKINENKDITQITDELSKEIFAITNRTKQGDIKDSETIIDEVLAEFAKQKAAENKDIVGLDTGFDELNHKIKGFKNGDLIIIAARPGMGKTSMGLVFIEQTLRAGGGVVFFSLEMPAVQIMQRLISAKTLIPLQRIVTADLNDDEWERVNRACEDYAKSHLFIYDSGYATITNIRMILRFLPMISSVFSCFGCGVNLGVYSLFSSFARAARSFSSCSKYTSSRYTNKIASASCSIAPLSRKSLNIGRLFVRLSRLRFSCESAIIGMFCSRAKSFKPREISLTCKCLST